ncbi:MAG: hypothetical protein LUE21_02905 [Oscillospiraceae bacterium]|nr:hypothetical protein [Oscillospiraceae bacterium]
MKKSCKILALILALCMVLSVGAFASSDMPDTSMGGSATSSPPDNSTKAVDILGTRAALYIEYGEDGYTVSQNVTDAYEVEYQEDVATPEEGETYTLSGIYIYCGAEDWDDEEAVGNSGLVINQLTDETTPVVLGGEEDYYEAPDGETYNSVIVMETDEEETLASDATETAPGVALAFNGSAIELKNVYVESNGTGRPTVHIPSTTRDSNATQLPDLICVDSMFVNHSTRALLLMGGDVWFLNSTVLTNSWGGLSYDNTSTTMYVVNSDVENIGTGGYAIYDAAGCTAFVYGSRVLAGNTAITVCRTAVLTVDSLENADETATDPYDGEADLLTASATEDGTTELIAHDYPIKIHADMAGADSVAEAYLYNAYISTLDEDLQFADGTTYADWDDSESTGVDGLISEYQSGALVFIASHNGKVVIDNCELASRTGILVHSMFTYDSMASGIYPVDGTEYVGDEVVLANLTAEGDILHEDYMRKMILSLENADLTGAVVGTTLAAWNTYWTEAVEALPEDELEEATDELTAMEATLKNVIYNDTYETVWGVRMSMDADSVWTVTGDSNLYSFTLEEGAVVQAPEGKSLAIYVDCGMSNDELTYDISTGTQIESFEPGVEYTGVVILVEDGADEAADSSEGALTVSVNDLLDAIGAEVSYDEEAGILTITDSTGLLAALLGDAIQ